MSHLYLRTDYKTHYDFNSIVKQFTMTARIGKGHESVNLDEFYFRWLEKGVIAIGNTISAPLTFNHPI